MADADGCNILRPTDSLQTLLKRVNSAMYTNLAPIAAGVAAMVVAAGLLLVLGKHAWQCVAHYVSQASVNQGSPASRGAITREMADDNAEEVDASVYEADHRGRDTQVIMRAVAGVSSKYSEYNRALLSRAGGTRPEGVVDDTLVSVRHDDYARD